MPEHYTIRTRKVTRIAAIPTIQPPRCGALSPCLASFASAAISSVGGTGTTKLDGDSVIAVGAIVGDAVGAPIGTMLGAAVGAVVGTKMGATVGATVGAMIGKTVGGTVCGMIGAIVGVTVCGMTGTDVGEPVGAGVTTKGALLGLFVIGLLLGGNKRFSGIASENTITLWLTP